MLEDRTTNTCKYTHTCAKKLDISSSWFDTISPFRYTLCWLRTMPMKSQGTMRPCAQTLCTRVCVCVCVHVIVFVHM